ncbi:MAG TPA: gamma-glutamyl-gamma-aminobutyrate hydrolase family protein [Candidatus Aminicenantes bacterium]|nr:gamma-glutamyl-gamma-aminobutyrate hydrolase family protein [Candidatus Aminicenantes bacterium]
MPSLSLLLVNLYHRDGERKVVPYLQQVAEAALLSGVDLATTVTSWGERPVAFGRCEAVMLTGSHRMISAGEYDETLAAWVRECPLPLLGICYGHQLLARAFGGGVVKDRRRHQGPETLNWRTASPLREGLPDRSVMVESHEEVVLFDAPLADSFRLLAENDEGGVEAIVHRDRPLFGVQFHPEQSGEPGRTLLTNFLRLAASR